MSQNLNNKPFDLEERTHNFAQEVRSFIRQVPRTISNIQDCKQLVRSSGSVAANYIEANESLSKKDFAHRIKICKKESKESRLWLKLIDVGNDVNLVSQRDRLVSETLELMKIFGSIIEKSK